eukprot:35104-Chlamydomonas_euryale.AAC.3
MHWTCDTGAHGTSVLPVANSAATLLQRVGGCSGGGGGALSSRVSAPTNAPTICRTATMKMLGAAAAARGSKQSQSAGVGQLSEHAAARPCLPFDADVPEQPDAGARRGGRPAPTAQARSVREFGVRRRAVKLVRATDTAAARSAAGCS